jgi:hypothetical protein
VVFRAGYLQSVILQIWSLISNIGGVLGMAAGMSAFSVVEIVFTSIQVIIVLITGRGY